MLGVIVNTLAVLAGSSVGLLLKQRIPKKITDAIMTAIGLCTLYIGISGALQGSSPIVLIVSLVLGTAAGTLLDIDGKLGGIGKAIEKRISKNGGENTVAQGFITGSLLFCVGAMTIVGSLNSGLTGDHTLIFTKSALDLISSCMLAGTLGIGVMFAAIFVFVVQGALVLMAGLLQSLLTDPMLIAEITCVGSVMIIGLGLNLLGLSKFKIADMLPGIIFAPFVYLALRLLNL